MVNAVLLYTGNVTSTPTVEYVRSSGNVFVPVVEHFDQYLFHQRTKLNDEKIAEYLCEILSDLYAGRVHSFLRKSDLTERNESIESNSYSHTFFKWRPFEISLPDASRLASIFRENEVRPIIIRRASVIEQCVKILISEKAYGSRHQQFLAGRMSDDEYQSYLEEQQKLRIRIDEEDMCKIMELCRQFVFRTKKMIKQRNWFFSEVKEPDLVMVAEDFYQPQINKERFDRFFKNVFGDDFKSEIKMDILTRKAGLNISSCENYDEVASDPDLIAMEKEYLNLEWVRND